MTNRQKYDDGDWDTYRNHSIGFVFQNYNLIPHLTVLENVELSMIIAGIPKSKRRKKAEETLIMVGLKEKINKRPNELSGGQLQRVSIARALVTEPNIILADEPTGALDTETSENIMKLLKEISKTKLVIMVTHNPNLAYKYSDRIIKMLDGKILEDSDSYIKEENKIVAEKQYKKKQSSMSLLTAIKLSWRNLLSKKRRTIITSLAASIGIIGIAVILSISSGMQKYIDQTMLDSASFNYISINSQTSSMAIGLTNPSDRINKMEEYPENTTGIYPYEVVKTEIKQQKLDSDFINYLETNCHNDLAIDISYSYSCEMNILTTIAEEYVSVSSSAWNEVLSNSDYLKEYYTILAKDNSVASAIPSEIQEVALVVDKYNRLSTSTLDSLGIPYDSQNLTEIKYTDLIGKEFRIVFNNGWYIPENANGITIYRTSNTSNYKEAYESEFGITVKIISVLRECENSPTSWLKEGIAYSPKLTQEILKNNKTSDVAIAQYNNKTINVINGNSFKTSNTTSEQAGFGGMVSDTPNSAVSLSDSYESMLEKLGYTQTPSSIIIYPKDVDTKEMILSILDAWNENNKNTDKVIEYIDMSTMMTSILGTIVDIVTYVLMAFSITSLVISSIMIAIIIYASVIERIKEIGVLRAIGSRKKDVSRVFKAEAGLLGFLSGTIAIFITLLINAFINMILNKLVGVNTIANLDLATAIILIILSIVLLLIASLIPAKIASKKEPAVALRTE